MACAVTCPDYKVYVVCEMFCDPVKSGIDEREWRVAVARLSAVVARCTMAAMTEGAGFGRGVGVVEGVWVDVCNERRVLDTNTTQYNDSTMAIEA